MGYTRIRRALYNLGHEIGRNTIKRILLANGIEPAPERKKTMSWKMFLKAHWGAMAATDFFSVEVLTPARSPKLNAYAERFVRSIKSECLARIIPLGERHLRNAVSEYTRHDHPERNHQGLGNRLIEKPSAVPSTEGDFEFRERVGGMLKYYDRRAA